MRDNRHRRRRAEFGDSAVFGVIRILLRRMTTEHRAAQDNEKS
jgi:hypothetical protein